MADSSLPQNPERRAELQHEVFRAILDALRTFQTYQHSRFVSAVLGELIDDERMPLQLLVDAIDNARNKLANGGKL